MLERADSEFDSLLEPESPTRNFRAKSIRQRRLLPPVCVSPVGEIQPFLNNHGQVWLNSSSAIVISCIPYQRESPVLPDFDDQKTSSDASQALWGMGRQNQTFHYNTLCRCFNALLRVAPLQQGTLDNHFGLLACLQPNGLADRDSRLFWHHCRLWLWRSRLSTSVAAAVTLNCSWRIMSSIGGLQWRVTVNQAADTHQTKVDPKQKESINIRARLSKSSLCSTALWCSAWCLLLCCAPADTPGILCVFQSGPFGRVMRQNSYVQSLQACRANYRSWDWRIAACSHMSSFIQI